MNFVDVHDSKATSFSMIRKSTSLLDTPWFWFMDHMLVNAHNLMLQNENKLKWSASRKKSESFRLAIYKQWMDAFIAKSRPGGVQQAQAEVQQENAPESKAKFNRNAITPVYSAGRRCQHVLANGKTCKKTIGIQCAKCDRLFCFTVKNTGDVWNCYKVHKCKKK